jgi:tetratricopeptide (TPR) repeat protein
VMLTEGPSITPEDLGVLGLPGADAEADAEAPAPTGSLEDRLDGWQREQLRRALEATRGNVLRAAARLGLTRATLRYRLQKYGLGPASRRPGGRRPRAREAASAAPPVATPPAPPAARWTPRLIAMLDVAARDAILDADVDMLVRKVEVFAGRVEEVGSARLVAAFGLDPAEDAARRAVLAALAARNALARREPPPAVTLAVHAEECRVREVSGRIEIDTDGRRSLLDTVAGLAAPGDEHAIVVSGPARALLRGRFTFDGNRLAGFAPPPPESRVHDTPFVGREAELAALRARWEDARRGTGQIVALVGEPGIGKSRLLAELRRLLGAPRELVGHAESYGRGIPYLPVVEMLRGFFALAEHDEAAAVVRAVRRGVLALDASLAPDVAPLLSLLALPDADPEWAALEPAPRRQRTLEALRRLVLCASRDSPLLVAFEDLHWIDAESQAFLDRLITSLPSHHLLVIVTHRPEYRHPVGPTSYTQLHLAPLAPASAERLARSLLGDDAALAALTHRLTERTGGNPFFLEESVRALVEAGGLVGDRGAYRLGSPPQILDVPASVRAVLAARLERLDAGARRVVQAAAVIGTDVPLPLLQVVAGLPEAELRRIVDELQSAQLLRETRVVPAVELAFQHALTQDVTYGTLPPAERRALHTEVVRALEARAPDAVERLAHHAIAAELWPEALRYGREAGARAAARSAHHEAVQHFESALKAIARLPQAVGVQRDTLDLYLRLRWSLVPLGDYHRLADSLRRAAAAAEALNDPLSVAEISQSMTNFLRLMGDCDGALEAGRRARRLARELGARTLEVRATYQLGFVYRQLGDYRQAIEALQSVVDALQGELLYERFGEPSVLSVHARAWLATTLAEVGRVDEAIALGEEAARIADEARNAFSQTTAHYALGTVLVRAGDSERGLPLLERAMALTRDGNFGLMLPHVASSLGSALTAAGRLGEALPLLRLAVDTAAAKGLVGSASRAMISLGRGLLGAGRLDEAHDVGRRSLDAARRHQERGHEAWALHLLGDVMAARDKDDPTAVAACYGDTLALAETLGMAPLVAECRRRLAALEVAPRASG